MNIQARMKRPIILFFLCAQGSSWFTLTPAIPFKSKANLDKTIGFPKVDILLKDADLIEATQALTRQTGVQFLIVPSEIPFQKINLSLKRLPVDLAIQYLCKAAGAWSKQDASGVFIICSGSAPENPAASLDMMVQRIRVDKTDVKQVYDQLMDSQKKTISKSEDASSVIKPTAKPEVTVEPEIYFPNPNLMPENVAQQYTPDGGTPPFPSYGGGANIASNNASSLSAGQGLVPQNIEYLTYDPTDNSLIVKGTEEAIRKLQQTVSTLDKAPKQILITVEFITTKRDHGSELGTDAGINSKNNDLSSSVGTGRFVGNGIAALTERKDDAGKSIIPESFTNYKNPLGLFLQYGKLALDLRANLSTSNSKIINMPILRTLNNQPANIEHKNEKTIVLTDYQKDPGSGSRDVQKTENLTASTFLTVTPRYNEGDDTITASILPQIEDFQPVSSTEVGGIREVSSKTSQKTKLVTRSKNGETIMIGGLTTRTRTRGFSRIPFLGDIFPKLFGKTIDGYVDNDLRIFITMSVIPDDPSQLFTPAGA